MVEKVKLFLATKCDRIRRLLKGGSGGITALSVESQMLLCLEEELSSATEGDKINAAGVIEEYFGDNQTCTVSNAADVGPTKKKQRRETSSKEDPRFIGMRCMDVDAKAVSVVELRTSSLKSHLHIMILTHDQVQHRLNCFSELLPSHVVVLDANLTAIRQLEVYSADTGNDVKVCSD